MKTLRTLILPALLCLFGAAPALAQDVDDGAATRSATYRVASAAGSEIAGHVYVGEFGPNATIVVVALQNTPPGGDHPVRIYRGDCDGDGDIEVSLSDVDGDTGLSVSLTDTPYDAVTNADHHVSVHQSTQAMEMVVACGEVGAGVQSVAQDGDAGVRAGGNADADADDGEPADDAQADDAQADEATDAQADAEAQDAEAEDADEAADADRDEAADDADAAQAEDAEDGDDGADPEDEQTRAPNTASYGLFPVEGSGIRGQVQLTEILDGGTMFVITLVGIDEGQRYSATLFEGDCGPDRPRVLDLDPVGEAPEDPFSSVSETSLDFEEITTGDHFVYIYADEDRDEIAACGEVGAGANR